MNCGCGSVYTLTPGDRLYLSAMVKSLQQRVSALEGGGVSSDLETFIGTKIVSTVPSWALQPVPPETGVTVEVDPTVPSWAKTPNKPTYAVAEITDAASLDYVDGEVAAHANRTDNPHNVTAAQIGAALSSDLAAVAFSGDFDDLDNKPVIPTPVPQVNADWNATSGVEQVLNKPALGTAAEKDLTEFATAAQGAKADSAIQPADLDDMAYVPDAPADGNTYARKNNTWAAVTPGGGGGGGGLIVLAADFTIYVRKDGNDSNDGSADTSGKAFLTLARAVAEAKKYWLAANVFTVNIGTGTYTENVTVDWEPGGTIKFTCASPGDVTVSSSSGVGTFVAHNGGKVWIENIKITTSGSVLGAVFALAGGIILVRAGCEFGTAANFQILATRNGAVIVYPPYKISGGALCHWGAFDGGHIRSETTGAITVVGTCVYSYAVLAAGRNGAINIGDTKPTKAGAGSFSGTTGDCNLGGAIYYAGGTNPFQGTSGITTATGGYAA